MLELSPTLNLLHNWTPRDQANLNDHDTDLGSSSPVFLPTVGGRHLLVQGGKDGQLHLLDRDRLDGTHGRRRPAGRRRAPGHLDPRRRPAAHRARGVDAPRSAPTCSSPTTAGTAAYAVTGGAHPHLSVAWQNRASGTSPVLAGGLLYVYDERDGTLDVYGPTSGARIATLRAATGHWNSPIVVGGRIILPVGSYHSGAGGGQLYIWHR